VSLFRHQFCSDSLPLDTIYNSEVEARFRRILKPLVGVHWRRVAYSKVLEPNLALYCASAYTTQRRLGKEFPSTCLAQRFTSYCFWAKMTNEAGFGRSKKLSHLRDRITCTHQWFEIENEFLTS